MEKPAEEMKINRVTELYVGLFGIDRGDGILEETIMFGVKDGKMQATVEHNLAAVPNMLELCDAIMTEPVNVRGNHIGSFRLLQAPLKGAIELDPEDYRGYEAYCRRCSTKR